MKALKAAIFLFVLLSVFSVSAAGAADFSASSVGSFRSCTCEVIANPVTIQNLDSSINQIRIDAKGNAAGWVTLVPSSLVLLPGEKTQIIEYIYPSCANAGVFTMSLSLSSNGIIKTLPQSISVAQCSQPTLQNNTLPLAVKPAASSNDSSLLFYLLISLCVIMLLLLLLLLLAMPKGKGSSEPKKEQTKPQKVEPLTVKRSLRYEWEKYFKRKKESHLIEKTEKNKSNFPWLFLGFLIFILLLVFLMWLFGDTSGSLIDSANITKNGTVVVLNSSKGLVGITGII